MAAIYGSDEGAVGERPEPSARAEAAAPLDVAALHRAHFGHLVRLAAMLVRDRESAQDVVQDAFATMQSRWRRFTDEDRALRYLRASVINGARTTLRRRRTALAHQADPPDDEQPAEHVALARLRDDSVRAAVARLPRRQREVILLRYLEDLPIAETARVLGITAGAVKSSAGRAMASLAEKLGEQR